jgi:uncharacterized membrane protein
MHLGARDRTQHFFIASPERASHSSPTFSSDAEASALERKHSSMLGFFIGAACLIGLVAVARRGRHRYWGHRGHHRGYAGRYFFHHVLERLDTTPGQEKVIRSALHDVKQDAYDIRGEVKSTRRELAAELRATELYNALLEGVFDKHDELLEKLRASLVRATGQVHGTLDEQQRRKLADMIESGPWGHAGC